MEIVNLICGDRRSLKYGESSVREDRLMGLSPCPVLARHITVISGRSAPRKAVAFVICAHAVKSITTGKLAFEVIDA